MATEAPIAPRRALAITLALVEELIDLSKDRLGVTKFDPTQVRVGGDGSVSFDANIRYRADEVATSESSECASSVGLVLFELLMARAPISSADAFEPGITSTLSAELSALIVRSVSDSATQWPTLDLWSAALKAAVGGAATSTPPSRARRDRRRRAVAVIALLLLALITIVVVVSVPGWWDTATRDEGSLGLQPVGQAPLAIS